MGIWRERSENFDLMEQRSPESQEWNEDIQSLFHASNVIDSQLVKDEYFPGLWDTLMNSKVSSDYIKEEDQIFVKKTVTLPTALVEQFDS